MEAQAAEEAKMGAATHAMVVQANATPQVPLSSALPMVQIFCPECREPKTVDMNSFWNRDNANRFSNAKCTSQVCKRKPHRIGKWFRRRNQDNATIQAWLSLNTCLNYKEIPARITLEFYNTHATDEVAASTTSKHQPPTLAAPTAKRGRRCS